MGNYRPKTRDYDLALESYKKAKSLGSKSAKLYYGMGMAHKYKGEFGLCENCMKLALEIEPKFKKALIVYSKISVLKTKMKKFNKIEKYYKKEHNLNKRTLLIFLPWHCQQTDLYSC